MAKVGWGLTEDKKSAAHVAQEIRDFKAQNPGADYSIGHIVLADFNLSQGMIWASFEPEVFKLWEEVRGNDKSAYIKYYLELAEVIKFLQYLMQYEDDFLERVADFLMDTPVAPSVLLHVPPEMEAAARKLVWGEDE